MKKPLLKFEQKGLDQRKIPIYYVYSHDNEFLGVINNSHIGRFFHWIFCPQNQTYYTNGCLKEITEFITKLYGRYRKIQKTT